MVETAGNKLRRARQSRQLSLEDAARVTRIREPQLADLEADEYSNFANLAYARSYLVNYGKYLRVDMRPYLEAFSDASTFGLDDYQYLSAKPVGVYRVPYRRRSLARRPQRRQLIGTAVALAICAVGIFGWLLTVNIRRLGDPAKLAARLEAQAHEKSFREGGGEVDAVTASVPAAPMQVENAEPGRAAPESPAAGQLIPVSAPATAPTAATPGPSVMPVPSEAPTQDSIPALAAAAVPLAAGPVLPVPSDNRVVREMLTARAAQLQPRKIANEHPRPQ